MKRVASFNRYVIFLRRLSNRKMGRYLPKGFNTQSWSSRFGAVGGDFEFWCDRKKYIVFFNLSFISYLCNNVNAEDWMDGCLLLRNHVRTLERILIKFGSK